MGKSRFELNRAGVRELMLSDEMTSGLEGLGGGILSRLGDGYSTNTFKGKNRVNVEISADTYEARKENMEENTILKAVQG